MKNLTEKYITDLLASLCFIFFFFFGKGKCPFSYSGINLLFECFFTICRMYREEIRMRRKGHRSKTTPEPLLPSHLW